MIKNQQSENAKFEIAFKANNISFYREMPESYKSILCMIREGGVKVNNGNFFLAKRLVVHVSSLFLRIAINASWLAVTRIMDIPPYNTIYFSVHETDAPTTP